MGLISDGYRVPPIAMLLSPQTLTNNWVNLGDAFKTDTYQFLGLWFDVDVNDALDIQFRVTAKIESTGDIFYNAIKTVSSSDVLVEPERYEFNLNQDQKVFITFELLNTIPWVQVQVKAITPGANPGKITQCHYSMGK